MMKSMIAENRVTFKELEKNIYAWVCEMGREFTAGFLGRYDRKLMEERDKHRYQHKGLRHYVYLLDETLGLDHIGLISTNMAELLVKGIIELSYRECAPKISGMTGQRISVMRV